MGNGFNLLKWGLTLGSEPQNFLGAKWIKSFLKKIPERKKRIWALRFLSLSPHYFIDPDNPEFKGMSTDQYLERSFRIICESREEIFDKLLKTKFETGFEVLDYGCGPGFLAKAAAPFVKKIYAVDISGGAIVCARIVNPAKNIEYLEANEESFDKIPDGKLDAVYSYAVVQHLEIESFEKILEICRKKLKPDGLLILHIRLIDEIWKTEEFWKFDKSMTGKIRYKFDLHCFGRSLEEYIEIVEKFDFNDIKFEKIEGFVKEKPDEFGSQRLLIARKKT